MKLRQLIGAGVVFLLAATGLAAQQANTTSETAGVSSPAGSLSVPRLILFSGTLKDLAGRPLTGPVELDFAIYKEQTDAAPLWQESQTLNLDEQGHYTALLGAMQPEGLPVDLFTSGEARWLGVSVGKLPEQPRVLLVSVPYALKANDAEMLGGKPASAYALAQPAGASTSAGTATAGATAPGGAAASELAAPGKPKSGPKPNLTGTGTKNYIPLWTDSAGTLGNSVMYQSAGLVGVGTATPGVALDVYGASAGLRLSGTGTHQVTITGATSGRLGQDAAGFFFSSDSNGAAIRFGTNNGSGHEWLRITSAGKVGIGTTSPAHALDVVGDINASTNMSAGGNLSVTGTITGNGAGLTALNATNLATGTVPSARISGTYSNALTFSSASNSFTGNGSGLTNVAAATAATATTASGLNCAGCVGNTQLGVNYAASTSRGGAASNALLLNGLASSAFQPAGSYAVTTGPNNFTGTQTVTGGMLGVGTSSPAQELDIVSHGGDSGTFIAVGDFVGSDLYGFSQESLQIRNPNYHSGAGQEIFAIGAEGYLSNAGAMTQSDLYIWDDKAGSGGAEKAVFQTGAGKIAFGNAITDSVALTGATFVIDSTGRAGIGTITPAHTLDVVGDINASTNITAGGVFTGNGSGLTNVTASTASGLSCTGCVGNTQLGVKYAASSAQGGDALNALALGGMAASAFQLAGSYATLGANTFSADQTLNAALNLAQTTGPDVGVINLGGNPLIHACCPNSAWNTFVGSSAGNFTADASGSYSGFGKNTATGFQALQALTSGYGNTAEGSKALTSNTTGYRNTANGLNALFSNTSGFGNTASGATALSGNTTGTNNTASGENALNNNITGSSNTADGAGALVSNTTGNNNTVDGAWALNANTTGSMNIAIGSSAGNSLVSGNGNVMVGNGAGSNFTSNESYNIDIGNNGVAGDSNVIRIGGGGGGSPTQTYIAGIRGVTPGGANPLPVIIDGNGQLGTGTSAVGTVTSVGSGTGLTGGPITTSGTLSLDTTFTDGRYAQLGAANTFTGNETLNGTLSASSSSGTPVSGTSTAASGATSGVSGATNSTTNGAAGVSGTANGATGQTFGVNGTTNSTSNGAAGVQGGANASTGQTAGVSGYTNSTSNFASGVSGGANASTGQTYGVQGGTISSTNGAAGVNGNAGASNGKTYGVAGSTSSTTNGAAGVNGNANGATGATYGVSGFTNSTSNGAAGVEGGANGASGQTTGVFGYTNSTTDFSYGVQGNANGAGGQTTGVFGTTNSTASNAGGVSGYASATTGQTYGTSGTTNSTTNGAAGVAGFANASTGQAFGVIGNTNSTTDGAVGVQGTASGATGGTNGVRGYTNSTTAGAAGVLGQANAATGQTLGVFAITNSTTKFAAGVQAMASAPTGQTLGVHGMTSSTTDGAAGVFGEAEGATGATYGVWGSSASSSGYGVFGNGATGVYGQSTTSGGSGVYGAAGSGTYAGYFNGNVAVTGSVTAASFTGAGLGTVTSVASGAGLTGGPITTSGTLSIATGAVTNAMLQNSSLAVNAGSGLTGGGSVSLGGSTSLNLNPNINGMASTFSDSNTSQVVSVTQSGSGMALVGTDSAYGSYGQLGTSLTVPSVGTFGTGVAGYGGTTNSTTYGVYGSGYDGVYGNGTYLGVVSYGGSYGLWATGGFAGVYGHSSDYAGVEGDNDGSATYGVLSVGNFAATGTKSAIVPLPDDRVVSLYAVESPENWFEDFGTGELHNGVAEVTLDPTFAQTVSTEAGYHVFLTPNGDCEGLFVATKTSVAFEVRELRGGKSDISFDYRIVARRKGYEKLRLQQVEADPETVQALRAQRESLSTSKLPKLIIHKALPGPPKVEGPEPAPPGVVIPKPPERPRAPAIPPALLGQLSAKE